MNQQKKIIPFPILNSLFKQSIFEEKLRRRMQEAVGSASKFFKQIFTTNFVCNSLRLEK